MFTKPEHKNSPQNIIQFRFRKSKFVLPKEPSNEELAFDWTLSKEDKIQVFKRRGSDNRLRFAVQLCVLRKYGRFLDDYASLSAKIIGYLSRQLEIEPLLTLSSHSREATESNYRNDIGKYLGYNECNAAAILELEKWILSIISDSYFVEDLLPKAEQFLFNRKIILPPQRHMEQIFNFAYSNAEEKLLAVIADNLPSEVKTTIDKLLDVEQGQNKSLLFKFSDYPPEPKAKNIVRYFKLYTELASVGISKKYFTNVQANLIKALAKAVNTYDAWRIKQFDDPKKYTLVSCYLFYTQQAVLDNLLYMHIRFMGNIEREAKNIYEIKHRQLRKKIKKGIKTLETFAKLYLSLDLDDSISLIDGQISRDRIKYAVEYFEEYRQLEETGKLEILHRKYPNFKRYFPLLVSLNFEAEKGCQYLLDAIQIARQYHCGELKKIPFDAPIQFVPQNWKAVLINSKGQINPRTWEISLAFAIKDALKSGDLFIPESQHYISFWNMVYSEKKWIADRARIYSEQGFPDDCQQILSQLIKKLHDLADSAIISLPNNDFIKEKNNEIRFSKDESSPESPEVKNLRQLIEASLPKIRIEHLLMEVDALCGFLKEIKPLEGFDNIYRKLPARFAAIVAQGTNLGIHIMAESTNGISVDVLQDITRSCLRDDSLKAANRVLVDYQKSLEASTVYGTGNRSSSDGQRFGVNRGSLIASMYPRYFGYYDQVVSVYTHVSDQYSVYSTQVISCAEREAYYVIDGLLDNQSSLDIEHHHTDTGGYTDHIFALCFLLGFSYKPRLKNLHKRRLFKTDKNISYDSLEPLFKGTINLELIKEQWDTMIRVAASLKNRIVPARVITQRLASSAPADRLSKAMTELGRLLKTIHILEYIQNEEIRHQIQRQLNLGEQRHAVAKHVFFANRGEFRSGDLNEIMNKATCLSILSNAILVWNTVRIASIVKNLRQNGHVIHDADLAKISPMMYKHVIVNGNYDFSDNSYAPIAMH